MRLVNFTIIVLLFTCSLILTGCKKFEEDDEWIHLRTVKNRIEGLKEMTVHTLGPTDLLPYWKERFGDFYLDFTLNSYDSPKKGDGYKISVFEKGTNEQICEGQWGFYNNGIFFHFDCLDVDTSKTWPSRIHGASGKILKLSNKDMRLRNEGILNDITQTFETQEIRFVEYKN